MKKVFRFLKSMTFGVILLGIIAVLSLAGSLIPQGQSVMTYVNAYPSLYRLILGLGLDHVFTSWYFIVLGALLCLNLIFCSIVRVRTLAASPSDSAKLSSLPAVNTLDAGEIEIIRKTLAKEHCVREDFPDGGTVYTKNRYGRYGTFFVHLGILLTILFWAAAMYLPEITDETCMPGESVMLADGTEIHVDSFSIETDGKLDFRSQVNIILPDGRESGLKESSVNHPVSFGKYKVYQQTYGTMGKVTVTDENGAQDSFWLETDDFLSADGMNGILYDNLYPDFEEENGQMHVVTSSSGSYKNPVYVYTIVENGVQTEVMLAFPGDVQEIGTYEVHFDEPVEYPGLRIKTSPPFINYCLLVSFLIMTAGLYMAFFIQPVTAVVNEEGYTILGKGAEGLKITLRDALDEYRAQKEENHA